MTFCWSPRSRWSQAAARPAPRSLRNPRFLPNRKRSRSCARPSATTALEARILALDPERITDDDVRTTLAKAPTPRIVLVHGGIFPVHLAMRSFGRFLIGMGYPEQRIRHPGDRRWSHSPYEDSAQIAGSDRVVLRARRPASVPDRPQPGWCRGRQGALRTGRQVHRHDSCLEPLHRCSRGSNLVRRSADRDRALRGRPRRAVRLGPGCRQRRAADAQPVEHAPEALPDSRHGRRVHRLHDRIRHLRARSRRRGRSPVPAQWRREGAPRGPPRDRPHHPSGHAVDRRGSRNFVPGSALMSPAMPLPARPSRPPRRRCSGRPTSGTASRSTGRSRRSGSSVRGARRPG